MPSDQGPQVKLEARERKVLDLVAGYQLGQGKPFQRVCKRHGFV